MAEEVEGRKEERKEEKKGGSEEESSKKRSLVKLLGIGTVSLGLVGGGGYVGYKKFVAKTPTAEVSIDSKGAKRKKLDKLGPLFKMDTFIVNLSGDSGARYLKASLEFEMSADNVSEELTSRIPQVRDLVLTLLSSKTFADISSTAGKFALREEMVSRLNEILSVGEVRQVYFTEFVVQ
jgi:flagellar FliL protein